MTNDRDSEATQAGQFLLEPIQHQPDGAPKGSVAVSSALSVPGEPYLLHNRGKTARRSFLRSVGLKTLIFPKRSYQESEKIIISGSWLIALTRAGVHILPISITLFLFVFNGTNFLNGPKVSNLASFFLQVAAKIHELLVVGSLTAIALDLVRSHILGDGLSIGLVSSGLSIGSPSWLWTIEFAGGFQVSKNLKKVWLALTHPTVLSLGLRSTTRSFSTFARSKIFLLIALVSLTILATFIGPSSALLFIPNDMWVPGPRTDFYIKGTVDTLWPVTLGANHTGPAICTAETARGDNENCLNGGWRKLSGVIQNINLLAPGWSLFMAGTTSRMIEGLRPVPDRDYIFGDFDTWGITPSFAVAAHVNYIYGRGEAAFSFAKGRNRRLRDFGVNGGGASATTAGRIPVVRTVCGATKKVEESLKELSFPVISEDRHWRSKPTDTGPTQSINISQLELRGWDGLKLGNKSVRQVRAHWLPMPAGLNGSSAMIYLLQNGTSTYQSVCVTDARWSQGQTLRSASSVLWSWSAVPSFNSRLKDDGSVDFAKTNFFDPLYYPNYGRTIQMEGEWLEALTPKMPEASFQGNELVMNTFEALVNNSKFNDPRFWDTENQNTLLDLENFATIFLLNALSRVGSSLQFRGPSSTDLDPSLHANNIVDDSFVSGSMIYNRRDPSEPYVLGKYEAHQYGTAWSLKDTGQRLAVIVLSIHLILAFLHTLLLLIVAKGSSEAWDSITELMILAYNSRPKPGAFENCSSGVVYSRTLGKRVRVGTRMKENGSDQAELVVCDQEDSAGNIEIDRAYS
ncbi:hypothetical protein GQ44DRAFT_821920 [Phaeosphaeriaceae sp. PMI808]|nr:hypothetical protein GQ44DRAFT_821920 [Phaeosphaeriaceae sp. PMI808]